MIILQKNKHCLNVESFEFKCAFGKNGISKRKKEGDKKTPSGIFEIENLYFRGDRIKKPITKLKTIEIKKNMIWCNDVRSRYYNKLCRVNKNVRHEKLFRKDNKYDLIIPIKYNFKNPIPGKGSCIFLHLSKNYAPTAGCIALSKNNFLILIKLLKKKSKIKI